MMSGLCSLVSLVSFSTASASWSTADLGHIPMWFMPHTLTECVPLVTIKRYCLIWHSSLNSFSLIRLSSLENVQKDYQCFSGRMEDLGICFRSFFPRHISSLTAFRWKLKLVQGTFICFFLLGSLVSLLLFLRCRELGLSLSSPWHITIIDACRTFLGILGFFSIISYRLNGMKLIFSYSKNGQILAFSYGPT